jgi:hypothetical protein
MHNLNSKNVFGMKPLAVALYYYPLSSRFATNFSQNISKPEAILEAFSPILKCLKLPFCILNV